MCNKSRSLCSIAPLRIIGHEGCCVRGALSPSAGQEGFFFMQEGSLSTPFEVLHNTLRSLLFKDQCCGMDRPHNLLLQRRSGSEFTHNWCIRRLQQRDISVETQPSVAGYALLESFQHTGQRSTGIKSPGCKPRLKASPSDLAVNR